MNLSYLANDSLRLLEALNISKSTLSFVEREKGVFRVCVLTKNFGYKEVALDNGIKDQL